MARLAIEKGEARFSWGLISMRLYFAEGVRLILREGSHLRGRAALRARR